MIKEVIERVYSIAEKKIPESLEFLWIDRMKFENLIDAITIPMGGIDEGVGDVLENSGVD